MTPMKLWMRAATASEQELMAQRAGTSRNYLYHLAASDTTDYKREPKPMLAAAIERETRAMNKKSNGRLPVILRTDLVKACRECEFARRCLGSAVIASEFPIVDAAALDAAETGGDVNA